MPKKMAWIKGQKDDPKDLCAHGKVQFEIDGESLVSVDDGEWTVSATALYLLRTIEADHTKVSPLFERVFPCCGFSMYDIEGEENVVICGCPAGIDFQITHTGNNVEIKPEGKEPIVISSDAWIRAVIGFSEAVSVFYSSSSSKTPDDEDDIKGFNKFMSEWRKRHNKTLQLTDINSAGEFSC